MNSQPPQAGAEYVEAILKRLITTYLSNQPIPNRDGERLTPELFHRLYCAVKSEGYGETWGPLE